MKHTKGKWEVKQADSKTVVVCGSMVIASDLYDENASPSIEEIDANANLMASSPDMLEALKKCSKYFINPLNMMGQEDEIMEQVLKAIIKAEGQG